MESALLRAPPPFLLISFSSLSTGSHRAPLFAPNNGPWVFFVNTRLAHVAKRDTGVDFSCHLHRDGAQLADVCFIGFNPAHKEAEAFNALMPLPSTLVLLFRNRGGGIRWLFAPIMKSHFGNHYDDIIMELQ